MLDLRAIRERPDIFRAGLARRGAADERQRLIESVKGLSGRLEKLEPKLQVATEEVQTLLSRIPNLPHDSVPDGEGDEDNRVEREVGAPPDLGFEARDHVAIGELLGAIDIERAAK